MKIGRQIAAARRRGVGLAVAVAVALMFAPLASVQAQLYECTTTTVTSTYRIFGIEVWREVESTTVCVQIA